MVFLKLSRLDVGALARSDRLILLRRVKVALESNSQRQILTGGSGVLARVLFSDLLALLQGVRRIQRSGEQQVLLTLDQFVAQQVRQPVVSGLLQVEG